MKFVKLLCNYITNNIFKRDKETINNGVYTINKSNINIHIHINPILAVAVLIILVYILL